MTLNVLGAQNTRPEGHYTRKREIKTTKMSYEEVLHVCWQCYQKRIRDTTSQRDLTMFTRNLKEFLHRIHNHGWYMDTFLYTSVHATVKNNRFLRVKVIRSAQKNATMDGKEYGIIIFIDYLEKSISITWPILLLLDRLKIKIANQWPHLNKKIGFELVHSATVFTRPDSHRLLPVFNHEEMVAHR